MHTPSYDTWHRVALCADAARSPFALLAQRLAQAQQHPRLRSAPVSAVAAGVVALAHALASRSVHHWRRARDRR